MSAARLGEMNLAAKSEDRATDPERLGTTGERRDTRWGSDEQCSIGRLNSQWRSDAETLRKRGATAQAVTLESCADEMETALTGTYPSPPARSPRMAKNSCHSGAFSTIRRSS